MIAHVVFGLRMGGLENGLVNLINRIPAERYRHAVVCLTGHDDFARRIRRGDVSLHDMQKRPGKDPAVYLRLYRLFRRLRPDIVHTRNLSALEAQVPAWLARVRGRVHGEHGWDVHDNAGANPRHQRLRRLVRPLVGRYIPLSRELELYLVRVVGASSDRITRICNGVDTERFGSSGAGRDVRTMAGFSADHVVIGSVGRMEAVKDPLNLARAFVLLIRSHPPWRERVRLMMVGDGRLRQSAEAVLEAAGVSRLAWFPGPREDIPALLDSLDVFALPSLAEGISNTILEAMASGLPIVATRVGGNPELVDEGNTAFLVPKGDPAALADAIARYVADPDLRKAHGIAGRARAEREFSMEHMVQSYLSVYDEIMNN